MQHIRLDIQKSIATITIDRPDCHNAMDEITIQELQQTLVEISKNPQVRILQLTGSGKSFCAGADLRWMQRMVNYTKEENHRDSLALAELLKTLKETPLPTIALVNGPAIGGGAGLVAACDIAIADENAFCQFSEVKIGLIPAVISPYVIDCIGPRATQYYFLTAEKISAPAACQLGLFQKVSSNIGAEAKALSDTLLKNSPAALKACKQLLKQVRQEKNPDALNQNTAQAIAQIRVSREGQEGLKSFLEKRKPTWIPTDV